MAKQTTEQKAAVAVVKRKAGVRSRAQAKLDMATEDLNAAIRAGAAAGVPKLTLHEASGYGSRQTIYDVLGKE